VVASGAPREVLTPALMAEVFRVRAAVVDHPLTGDPVIAFEHRTSPRREWSSARQLRGRVRSRR